MMMVWVDKVRRMRLAYLCNMWHEKKSFDDQSLGRPGFYWDRTKDSSKAGMETFEELAAQIQKKDRRGDTKFKKGSAKGQK